MTSRRLMAARVHVAEFTLDIRHIAGKENIVADMLSRPLASSPLSRFSSQRLDYVAIAAAQAAERSSLRLRLSAFSGTKVLCDIAKADPRPLIPFSHLCRRLHRRPGGPLRRSGRLTSDRWT